MGRSNFCPIAAFDVTPDTRGTAMPGSPFPHPPECPDCHARMRYVVIKPITVHSKVQRLLFVCVCGRWSEQTIVTAPDKAA